MLRWRLLVARCGHLALHLHLEGRAANDAEHDRGETIVLATRGARYLADRGLVVVFEPPSECISQELLGELVTKAFERESRAARRSFTPFNGVPSTSWPDASIGELPSVVRQRPSRSKFSSEKPIGSMIW